MKKPLLPLAFVALSLPLLATAANPSTCMGCHRAGSPTAPDLAGMNADKFAAAMHDYKSGARNNPTMKAMSMSLSDDDITQLAEHFAAIGK